VESQLQALAGITLRRIPACGLAEKSADLGVRVERYGCG